jgi:hypothetical protein
LPRCASQEFGRIAQVVARGAARYFSQVLGRGAQAVARGAARCVSQVLDLDAQAVARGAATLPQEKKNNSADAQRNGVNVNSSNCTAASWPSRQCTFGEFESLAVPWRRR